MGTIKEIFEGSTNIDKDDIWSHLETVFATHTKEEAEKKIQEQLAALEYVKNQGERYYQVLRENKPSITRESEKYYTMNEVANTFGVTKRAVQNWISQGRITPVKFNSKNKFSERELKKIKSERS